MILDLRNNLVPATQQGLGGVMMVSPPTGNFGMEVIGVLAGNTNWYSAAVDTIVPRARVGVVAQVHENGVVHQVGREVEVEWAAEPTGPWIPAPTSATGEARQSLVVASGSDRSLISRGQPMNRYFRVRFKTAGNATTADCVLYLNWGNIF